LGKIISVPQEFDFHPRSRPPAWRSGAGQREVGSGAKGGRERGKGRSGAGQREVGSGAKGEREGRRRKGFLASRDSRRGMVAKII